MKKLYLRNRRYNINNKENMNKKYKNIKRI